MAEELIPAAHLAAELNRSVTTLRNWRRAGYGPKALRVRGRVMYRRQSVDQWIQTMSQHAAEQYTKTEEQETGE